MSNPTRIVIVGGGFGGLNVAQTLEKLIRTGEEIDVTLISRDNFLLFTPFLTEVLGGMLDEADVISPIRALLKKTRFIMGEVTAVDVHAKTVTFLRPLTDETETLHADHLVLSLGSTSSFYGQDELTKLAFTLKSLDDATLLRNHLVACLEQANEETNVVARQSFLTVMVVGAGYTGVEAAGAIRDFMKDAARDYPHVRPDEVHVLLVDMAEQILPTIDPSLAKYAIRQLQKRGIELRLGQKIDKADERSVTLSKGECVPARTLLWSAGVVPSPLTKILDCKKDKKGAILCEPTMAVKGLHNVWALGDCASIPNLLEEGRPYTATAQNAGREAKRLAQNVMAVLRGRAPEPFLFRSLGEFVNLGHQVAVAQIKWFRFSGFLAWFLWRSVYLVKIPHWSRKARVVSGWTMDLLFGRTSVESETPRLWRSHTQDRRRIEEKAVEATK
jgi:NADH dehydrogenase